MSENAGAVRRNRTGWYRHVVALLISLALPAYAAAQVAPTRAPSQKLASPVSLSAITIDNFGRINANYYRGAQPRGHDYAELASLGVRTVIDLTKDGDPAEAGMAQAAGMRFYRIPMTTRETPTAQTVARFLHIVNDPANQPVYVHCQGGRHRTGVMTAAYRMTDDGWTADQAFAEMKQYKFGADFLHPEFKRFVYGFRRTDVLADATAAASASTPGAVAGRDGSAKTPDR